MKLPKLSVIAATALLFLGACESITGPRWRRVVGILKWEQQRSDSRLAPSVVMAASGTIDRLSSGLIAPDTVQAGVPFAVTVTTIGPTSCWEPAGAEVRTEPGVAIITPYDLTPEDLSETRCGDSRSNLARQVVLRFDARGEAVVRVAGRKITGQNFEEFTPTTIEKRVVVR